MANSEKDIQDVINTLIAEGVGEGKEGMRRIAETILNRAEQRGMTPAEVVRQSKQYTGYSSPGPAAVRAQRDPNAVSAAQAAWQLAQGPDDPTNGANHYWNPNIVNPSWAGSMTSLGNYGNHAFATDRAVAPRPISPTPLMQSAALANQRSNTSPSGGNTALQQALANRATAQRNQVTPRTMQGTATTVASIPTTRSLTQPNAINSSVNGLRQDPALAAALAARMAPSVGQAPTTRVVPTTRITPSASDMARGRSAVTTLPRQTVSAPRVSIPQSYAGQDRAPALSQARLPSSPIGLPALYGTMSQNRVNAIGMPLSTSVAPNTGFRVTSAAPTPLSRPSAFGVARPAPMMAQSQAPMPMQRPGVFAQRQPVVAPVVRQPVVAPLMAASARPPLEILVQGSNKAAPAQPMSQVNQLRATGLTPSQAYDALNRSQNPDGASRINGTTGLAASGPSNFTTRGYVF